MGEWREPQAKVIEAAIRHFNDYAVTGKAQAES